MPAMRLWVAAVLLVASWAWADDALRQSVLYFLHRADITAHVRLDSVYSLQTLGGAPHGRGGYTRFKVETTVVEGFKGIAPGPIEFVVTIEQPATPPRHGDYIVSLDRSADGPLVFADSSVLWVAATPPLLAAARQGR